jgi:hypothetical protein
MWQYRTFLNVLYNIFWGGLPSRQDFSYNNHVDHNRVRISDAITSGTKPDPQLGAPINEGT